MPFILIWTLGDSHQAKIVAIPIFLVCFPLQFWSPIGSKIRIKSRNFDIDVAVILIAIITLSLVLIIPLTSCEPRMHWWTWLICFLFILSGLLKNCKPWHFLWVLWTLSVYFSFHDPRHDCHIEISYPNSVNSASPSQPEAITPPKSRQGQWLSNLNDFINHTIDKINKTMEGIGEDSKRDDLLINNENRIKLDDAVANPKKYFACTNKGKKQPIYDIYIGKNALFDFNSIEITPDAKAYLQNLLKLLASQSNAKIILTGYSDNQGSDQIKLQTSILRAEKLKSWLVDENGFNPNHIQVQGGSDLNPITSSSVSGLQALNRRVELRLNCNNMD